MMETLLIILIIAVASSAKAETVPSNKRILGGAEVQAHSLPYQALIDTEFNTYRSWCGASLISTNYLLTAEHCIHK
jgi:secreted trypsin-like serine protease